MKTFSGNQHLALDVNLPPGSGPLFVLGLPRSFTSVVGTMLGQHPQMYGLPETHLFSFESLIARQQGSRRADFPMVHGLLRAVAELYFGTQTESTVTLADAWLRRRSHYTTGYLFETLAAKVYPRIVVDKSPSVVYRVEYMKRMYDFFPEAKFIHLLRHPRTHAESVMRFIKERKQRGSMPPHHWLYHLATYPHNRDGEVEAPKQRKVLDPQHGWYALNRTIEEFLESVPEDQKLRVRGEDLLSSPDDSLRRIASWMGVRDDDAAIDEMKHPERSVYACFGPDNARFGNDSHFLGSPVLRAPRAGVEVSLDGPLSWRPDGSELAPKVKQLARSFGYR